MVAWLTVALALQLAAGSPLSAQSAMQTYVEAMQPGWNLGNSLDATPNETAWGNPPATEALIQKIAAEGFKSIRIPVTWDTGGRVGPAPGYTIDPAFMDRVQQVVDWSLDAGLHVMLNMHHDSGWMKDRPADYLARYTAIWQQIASRFRDHPRELMLESINEPEFHNVDDAAEILLVNELNTIAYEVIRATGGGNATRPIVLPTVVTNSGQHFLDGLKGLMVELDDPNLIATIHFYGYWPFSVNIAGGIRVDADVLEDIHGTIDRAHDTFVAAGIPVVVGELGILSHSIQNPAVQRGEMLKFFEIFSGAAQAKGLTWQLWDAGQLLNRNTLQWRDPELIGYFLGSVTSRSSTGETDLVFVSTGAPADVVIPFDLNGNTFVSLTRDGVALTPGTDYAIDGNNLTLKAGLLGPYGTGGYGEKVVLEANFSAGMPWKLHVRHRATPVFEAKSGSKPDGIVIPVSFNGDLLATMEAKYAASPNYPYPGQAEWTSFKQFSEAYLPDYANGSISIKKEFFAATTNETVNLTIHFWSGRMQNYRLTFEPGGDIVTNPQQLVIFEDALASGWNDAGSWAAHSFSEATTVHAGSQAISMSAGAWGGLVLTNGGPAVDTSAYKTLVFWIHGGTTGGQTFGVGLNRGADDSSPRVAIPTPQANTWRKVEIPLSSLGVEGSTNITGVFFQNWSASAAGTVYIDGIHLTTAYASDLVFVHGTPAPVISSPTTLTVARGAAMSYTADAGNDPDTFSVSGLPSWLAFNASTGVISGTPATIGTYRFTLTVSNEVGSTSEEITVRVAEPLIITFPESSDLLHPRVEVAYDGATHGVVTETLPAGIPVQVTYEGGTTLPKLPGTYSVVATSIDEDYAGSAEATLVITSPDPGRLINLSIRAVAGTDSATLIIGFAAQGGSGDAPVLVRGIGPRLADFKVGGTLLADPRLTLFEDSDPIVTNDDWDASLAPIFKDSGAFSLPIGSKDAALAAALPAGSYTAHITGASSETGIALGEIYDLTETYSPMVPVLINASARCQVGSGAEVLIPGFVIGGSTPLRVLIRAVGPRLADFKVDDVLADPRLTLYQGDEVIGSNDDWEAALAATFAKVSAFGLRAGSKDAALVVELPPGEYTAHVQSADGAPGVALVEVYALPGL